MPQNWGMQLLGAKELIGAFNELIAAYTTTQNYRVWTDTEYAPYQEYGTIYHGAQPHFRPAVQSAGGSMSSVAQGSVTVADLQRKTAEQILNEARARAPYLTGQLRGSYQMGPM